MALVDQLLLGIARIGTEFKSVRSALGLKSSGFDANDFGWLGWTTDPANASAAGPNTGRVWTTRAKIAKAGTIANLTIYVNTAGASVTHGYLAVYKLDGTRLGVSADQVAGFQTVGAKTVAITADSGQSLAVNPGDQLIFAYLVVATTVPSIACNAAAPMINALLGQSSGVSSYRAGVQAATAQTTMPTSLIMTTQGLNSNPPCIVAT